MSVLRRAYVEVEPDVTGFDTSLREKFERLNPGGKAGRQLGGQLNRALKRLDLDPIDIKTDPRTALANLGEVERKLVALSAKSSTVEIKIQAERGLAEINRFRKQLGSLGDDAGPEAALGFFARFSGRLGPLLASMPVSGPIAAGLGVGAAAAAPALAAAVAAAVVGGAGIGGVLGGVTLAARHPLVKSAGSELGAALLSDLQSRAGGFTQPVLNGIERVRAGWLSLGPDLDRVFGASRFVEPMIDSGIKAGRGFLAGFADAVDASDPVVESLRIMVSSLGVTAGEVFTLLAQDAKQGASAVDDLTLSVNNLVSTTGGILHGVAQLKGYADQLDTVIDRGRYWAEDNAALNEGLGVLGLQVDFTADGFARGSVQAEAYRKATLGTATAADFATLKQAKMTDAQIAAADASGTYRSKLNEVKAAAENSAAGISEAAKESQRLTIAANPAYKAMEELASKLRTADAAARGERSALKGLSDQLRADIDPAFALINAQNTLKTAQDKAAEATRKHGSRSKEAKAATRELAVAAVDLQGKAGALAQGFSGRLTPSMRATFQAAGLTKGQIRDVERQLITAKKAADKYAGNYKANVYATGVPGVAGKLNALSELQSALKRGASPPARLRRYLGDSFDTGGYTGPGHRHQVAGIVHADEYVVKKSARQKIERRHPGLLDEMNATGQVPGYAKGGMVWPFPVTAAKTRIPSAAEASSKVMPNFGSWPSSPAAQRGDSGVWRSIVRLIKSTGPLSGSFGNAYRPGDPKWHGSGRAVDWMGYNQDALATFLSRRRPLELIHRTRKRDYAYTRGKNKGSFNESLMNAHRNHVHIAMANGGTIREPVFGVGRSGRSYSFGENGPETVTPGGVRDIHIHIHEGVVVTSKRHAEDLVVDAVKSARRGNRL